MGFLVSCADCWGTAWLWHQMEATPPPPFRVGRRGLLCICAVYLSDRSVCGFQTFIGYTALVHMHGLFEIFVGAD